MKSFFQLNRTQMKDAAAHAACTTPEPIKNIADLDLTKKIKAQIAKRELARRQREENQHSRKLEQQAYDEYHERLLMCDDYNLVDPKLKE